MGASGIRAHTLLCPPFFLPTWPGSDSAPGLGLLRSEKPCKWLESLTASVQFRGTDFFLVGFFAAAADGETIISDLEEAWHEQPWWRLSFSLQNGAGLEEERRPDLATGRSGSMDTAVTGSGISLGSRSRSSYKKHRSHMYATQGRERRLPPVLALHYPSNLHCTAFHFP